MLAQKKFVTSFIFLALVANIAYFVFVFLHFDSAGPSVSDQFWNELVQGDYKEDGMSFQITDKSQSSNVKSLRERIQQKFSYDKSMPIEKNIWQMWKVNFDDPTFPDEYKGFYGSWSEKNSDHYHYVFSNSECDRLVNYIYGDIPEIVQAYNALPKIILRADFFRYLIMYSRGGVYSDIDTMNLKPIAEWSSSRKNAHDNSNIIGFAIGVEADFDDSNWDTYFARRVQICQWTFQSKKGHPILAEIIARITEKTLWRRDNNKLNAILDGKDEGNDVMNWTGPGLWTDTIFDYLNKLIDPSYKDNAKSERVIDWHFFTDIKQPISIQDVMVFPITSFSPTAEFMHAKGVNDELAYVEHRFGGSWKQDQEQTEKQKENHKD